MILWGWGLSALPEQASRRRGRDGDGPDQVFCSDSGRPDTSAEDRCSRDPDAPVQEQEWMSGNQGVRERGEASVPSCACDAEADVEPHSGEGPDIRAGLLEECARVELGP